MFVLFVAGRDRNRKEQYLSLFGIHSVGRGELGGSESVLMQHPTSLAASLLLRSRKENESRAMTGNLCIHSCSGVLFADDLAAKANVLIDPAELQAVTMDDLDEDEESATSAAQVSHWFWAASLTSSLFRGKAVSGPGL